MPKRTYTPEFKAQAILLAKANGVLPTMRKLGIPGNNLLYTWIKQTGAKGPKPKRSPKASHLDTIVYLKKAWRLILRDVRNGEDLSEAALYVKHALISLQGESE